MTQYTLSAEQLQNVVNVLDEHILVMRSLPMVNPMLAQRAAALIGALKRAADEQDAATAQAATPGANP